MVTMATGVSEALENWRMLGGYSSRRSRRTAQGRGMRHLAYKPSSRLRVK